MAVARAVWWALAVVALSFTAWFGTWPMVDVSLSCSKSGELYLEGGRSSWGCTDSIVDVVGLWPLVVLGVVLAVPPVAAALTRRQWVSWLAVAALVGVSIAGLVHWSSHWMARLFAAPMAAVGLVAATAHQGARGGGQAGNAAAVADSR